MASTLPPPPEEWIDQFLAEFPEQPAPQSRLQAWWRLICNHHFYRVTLFNAQTIACQGLILLCWMMGYFIASSMIVVSLTVPLFWPWLPLGSAIIVYDLTYPGMSPHERHIWNIGFTTYAGSFFVLLFVLRDWWPTLLWPAALWASGLFAYNFGLLLLRTRLIISRPLSSID